MILARTRKLIQISILSFLFIALIGVFFLWFNHKKANVNAVPEQTAMLLEFSSLSMLNLPPSAHDPSWQILFDSRLCETARTDIDLIRKCLGAGASCLDSGVVLSAFTLQETDSLHGLWVFNKCPQPGLAALIKQVDPPVRWFPATFQGCDLYVISMPGNAKMVCAEIDGWLLCSRYSYLVEDAISQFRASKNWWADQQKMRDFAPGSPYRLFIRPEAFITRATQFSAKWQSLPRWFQQHFKWLGFGVDAGQTIGYAETDGRLPDVGSIDAQSGKLFSVIPDDAAFIAQTGINPTTRFGPHGPEYNEADFARYIQPWLGNNAAFVLTQPFSNGLLDNQFLLFSIQDLAGLEQSLGAYGKARGILRTEEYQTFTMTSFLNQSLLAPFCGQSEAFRNPVFAVVGEYAVFGGSRSALEIWIDKYIVNQTIVNQTDFLQLKSKLPGKGNAQGYFNLDCLPALWTELTGDTRPVRVTRPQYAGLLGIEAQEAGEQALRLNLGVQPRGQATAAPAIFWKTPLNAPARTQPYLCFGADSTLHIFIQDARNELYCISMGGAIEWRLQLDGPLLSGIRGCDYFANGTACFLMNTPNKIWILNEKGASVNGFPLPLQSPALNGLTLIDFDGNSKYSFFVACKNRQVYGFDQYGRPLPGWNPQGGVGVIHAPIVHYQYMNMDFLAMLDVSGKLSVYGRNGMLRFPALQLKGAFFLPLQLDTTEEKPVLLCFSRSGQLNRIAPDGSISVGQCDPTIPGALKAAVAGALWEHREKVSFILTGSTYQVVNWSKGRLQTLLKQTVDASLDTMFMLPDQTIGALSRSEKRIYQLPSSRKASSALLPLAGSTPFTELEAPFPGGVRMLFAGNGPFLYAYKL